MKNYKTETKTVDAEYMVSVTCDCCKNEFSDVLDIQEFHLIDETGGYNSAVGDEVRYQCDLCSGCVKKLLGKYLRLY